ncbi:GNAT family N-acetyltransferase [uncultured Vagococcus sp.]|uniref:GNAT family N-acetyltransferase n=1 Tax=uncultured Vagococcus sp. TaxID=189676 RepID=UPI0028D5F4BB|nr:GNAT family N-acetyltransferase [uncultured Vagococcus sp.]
MKKIRVSQSVFQEKTSLSFLYEEACPHFMQVEGRRPLKPLEDIREHIGVPPEEVVTCYTIYYGNDVAGYAWILEKPKIYYYILHFYIGDDFKRRGIGKEALLAFDAIYKKKGISQSELLVSGSNYFGLAFWVSMGYNSIVYFEAPAENSPTTSVELELAREF